MKWNYKNICTLYKVRFGREREGRMVDIKVMFRAIKHLWSDLPASVNNLKRILYSGIITTAASLACHLEDRYCRYVVTIALEWISKSAARAACHLNASGCLVESSSCGHRCCRWFSSRWSSYFFHVFAPGNTRDSPQRMREQPFLMGIFVFPLCSVSPYNRPQRTLRAIPANPALRQVSCDYARCTSPDGHATNVRHWTGFNGL